jgi:hypothetical protein
MIPICWKCCHKIVEPDVTGCCYRLIGCEICAEVKDYSSAQKFCPIIKEPQPHITKPLIISNLKDAP